ncbi:MAG: P-loop NTPase [Proteobacteria bacterium]|nr:P-loop NTPase [Pseudomonadota bacterium]MBU1738030.1 P-loop NTPase [Pseudomonadota bacterium]
MNGSNNCKIWAIGGGKGGVGKSFVLSSIGMNLAKEGRVVMIDADLGGANLHNFLGIHRPKATLSDFFENKTPLEELISETGVENLGLLSGVIGSLGAEGIKYAQKKKLFAHIKQIKADHILIDLGAGAHHNTIDTFLLADKMVLVIVPEIISIENMYNFLRNVFFRRLGVVLSDYGYRDLVVTLWKDRKELGINNFRELVDYLKSTSDEVRDVVTREVADFKVHLILNKARTNKDIMIGNSVKSICRKFFGINALYSGYVEYDELVSRSINQRQTYMTAYPDSRCARELERLTRNLLAGRQVKIIK